MGSTTTFRLLSRVGGAVALVTILAAGRAAAEPVTVTVLDRDGRPVPDVAVFVEPSGSAANVAPAGTKAVMDQVDQRFVPHVLVVQTGTEVDFPNSDVVAHHVYSFSHPNHFKLPIYKGRAHPPVQFEESGVVVLGCNIHDHMLAYIVVVDTPSFAKTNDDGVALVDTNQWEVARVSIWSPRIRDDEEKLSVSLEGRGESDAVAFRLNKALRPRHEDQSEVLSWSEY